MITLRKSDQRGETILDWLKSKHTFSFGHYHDDAHMGFGPLRVINEDVVKASTGFGTHPHRDMEIISYIIDGALEHKDSIGTGSVILPGEVQRMSAGTGILHSEYNPMRDRDVHFLQIWIMPATQGLAPSYEQKNFKDRRQPGQLTLLACADGRDNSVTVHQDVLMFVLDLEAGQSFTYPLNEGRMLWTQVVHGEATLNDQQLHPGDGAAVRQGNLVLSATSSGEILLIEVSAV